MRDFVNWCADKGLINIHEDGTVVWKEDCTAGKKGGGRDGCKDLSGDYKGHFHKMDTVWPFKVVAKGGKKAVAPVAK